MEWIRDNILFFISIFGGAFLSVFTIETHSIKEAFTRTICGVFCAFFFTDPLIDIMSLDADIYKNAIAGLFAISGYSLSKLFANISFEHIIAMVKTIRGGK